MKVRELIAQLQDDIDPEAEIVMSWRHADGSSEGTAINHIEAGRSLWANDDQWRPFVKLVGRGRT
jgi:hypothetical protein